MWKWNYVFYVFESQDRATRFTDATGTNPSITPGVQADAEQARDIVFAYIDEVTMDKPYKISASGVRDGDNLYSFNVSVNKESG